MTRRRYGRTNTGVILHWIAGKAARADNLWSDGESLFSYDLCIGRTIGGFKVVLNYTATGYAFVSMTTSHHVNLAARYADDVEDVE